MALSVVFDTPAAESLVTWPFTVTGHVYSDGSPVPATITIKNHLTGDRLGAGVANEDGSFSIILTGWVQSLRSAVATPTQPAGTQRRSAAVASQAFASRRRAAAAPVQGVSNSKRSATSTPRATGTSKRSSLSSPFRQATEVTVRRAAAATPRDVSGPSAPTFSVPGSSDSTTLTGISISGTDAVGVVAYFIKDVAGGASAPSNPASGDAGWVSVTPTTSYSTSSATHLVGGINVRDCYCWLKDAAGNVSSRSSVSSVTITVDVTKPSITSFTLGTPTDLNVKAATLTATDNIGVTGYLLTESSSKPDAGSGNWQAASYWTTTDGYTFGAAGTYTLYAWAKDAAGNVSDAYTGREVTVSEAGPTDIGIQITFFAAVPDGETVTQYVRFRWSGTSGYQLTVTAVSTYIEADDYYETTRTAILHRYDNGSPTVLQNYGAVVPLRIEALTSGNIKAWASVSTHESTRFAEPLTDITDSNYVTGGVGSVFTDGLTVTTEASLTPVFPLVHDGFDRANGALGRSWAAQPGVTALSITNSCIQPGSSVTRSAYWNQSTNADQWSQVVVSGSNALNGGPAVRMSGSANTCYWFTRYSTTYSGGNTTDVFRLYKVVAGTTTQLGADYSVVTNGQDVRASTRTLRLEVSGATLTPYVNDTPLATRTDNSIASGYVGLRVATAGGQTPTLDNCQGGNL